MPNKHQVLGDFYYKEAKREGYRSRSALKLKEIASSFKIIRRGDFIVDLGAAPGGWLQVEREMVGDDGIVVGIDLSFIRPLPYDNIRLIRGDVEDPKVLEEAFKFSNRSFDVILSDLAPKFSGVRDLDHARQIGLAMLAVKSAPKYLKKGGAMVIKVLMGPEFESFCQDVRRRFIQVKIFKPKASRDSSSETYLICKGFKG
jgi:23S rRNA (uridine2552-2'-O)-methyltransferase